MSLSISVGVFDWARFAQTSGYYPEDLPEDWRLDYFSNEFESCCIDLAGFDHEPAYLAEWFEDSNESFELSLAVNSEQHLNWLRQLMDNTDRCVIHALIVDDHSDSARLTALLQQGILESAGNFEAIPVIRSSDLWRPESGAATSDFALLPASSDLRQTRNWVEQWFAQLKTANRQKHATLWLPAAETNASQLMALRQLVELMGY